MFHVYIHWYCLIFRSYTWPIADLLLTQPSPYEPFRGLFFWAFFEPYLAGSYGTSQAFLFFQLGYVWKCWVNTPNEIAIFHRDNDQQNHWVQWGTLFSDRPICTGSSAHELSQATIRIRTIYGEGEIRGKAGRRLEWDRQQENRSHKACRTHTSYNMYVYTYIYIVWWLQSTT